MIRYEGADTATEPDDAGLPSGTPDTLHPYPEEGATIQQQILKRVPSVDESAPSVSKFFFFQKFIDCTLGQSAFKSFGKLSNLAEK